jgi:O-antigen/teichoic acid export membrane protein
VRTGGYVLGLLLAVVSAPLLIRHLGVVTFGEYVTAVSIMTITTGVTEGGLGTLALREYSVLEGRERWQLMRSILGLRLALSAAGIVAGLVFALIAGYRDLLVLGTVLAGVGLALGSAQALIIVPLQAELRVATVTLLELLRQVLLVALMVALVLAGAGLLPFLATFVVATLPVLVVAGRLLRGRMPLLPSFAPGMWGGLLRDMLPFAAVAALSVIYFRLTVVLMSLVSTGEETGYFATGFRVLEAFIGVPSILVTTVFPILARAARDDMARLRYAMDRVLRIAVIGGLWLALSVALGADFIVEVLAGDEGEPAVDVLRIQAFALLATFVGSSCGYALLSVRRQRAVVIAMTVGLLVNAILTLVLASAHGAVGAAAAMTFAEFVICFVAVGLLLRSGSEVRFPLRPLLPVLPAGAAFAAFALTGLPSVVQPIAGSVVYFAILIALRALPTEVFDALRRREGR